MFPRLWRKIPILEYYIRQKNTQKNVLVKFTQLLSKAKVGAYSRMSKVYSSFGVVITQLTFYSKQSVILETF